MLHHLTAQNSSGATFLARARPSRIFRPQHVAEKPRRSSGVRDSADRVSLCKLAGLVFFLPTDPPLSIRTPCTPPRRQCGLLPLIIQCKLLSISRAQLDTFRKSIFVTRPFPFRDQLRVSYLFERQIRCHIFVVPRNRCVGRPPIAHRYATSRLFLVYPGPTKIRNDSQKYLAEVSHGRFQRCPAVPCCFYCTVPIEVYPPHA